MSTRPRGGKAKGGIRARYQLKKSTKPLTVKEKKQKVTAENVWNDTFAFQLPEDWFEMVYVDGGEIFDQTRVDVMYEIASLYQSQGEDETRKLLESAKDPDDILWKRPEMKEGEEAIQLELKRRQTIIKRRVGPGLCSRCQCTRIMYTEESRMGLEEGAIQKAECTSCFKTWKK